MSGVDLYRLPADRSLNVIEHLFEKDQAQEKEMKEHREKVRAQMSEGFRLPKTTSAAQGSRYTWDNTSSLKEGEVDEFGRVMPARRAPGPNTKPFIPITRDTGDENNPFGLREDIVG